MIFIIILIIMILIIYIYRYIYIYIEYLRQSYKLEQARRLGAEGAWPRIPSAAQCSPVLHPPYKDSAPKQSEAQTVEKNTCGDKGSIFRCS